MEVSLLSLHRRGLQQRQFNIKDEGFYFRILNSSIDLRIKLNRFFLFFGVKKLLQKIHLHKNVIFFYRIHQIYAHA